jgi:hypothetical protein
MVFKYLLFCLLSLVVSSKSKSSVFDDDDHLSEVEGFYLDVSSHTEQGKQLEFKKKYFLPNNIIGCP